MERIAVKPLSYVTYDGLFSAVFVTEARPRAFINGVAGGFT